MFEQLERFWQQRRPSDTSYSFGGTSSVFLSSTPEPAGLEPPVRVLATTRVAGLDATVLDGRSFVAIGDWLRQNGYEYREQLSGWLEPYVRAGYKIVAFKYAKDAQTPRVGSSRLASPWVTFFEETTAKRSQSGDLFLQETATPQLVQATPRAVHEAIVIPVELLALTVAGGVVAVVLLRRGKSEEDEEDLAEQE